MYLGKYLIVVGLTIFLLGTIILLLNNCDTFSNLKGNFVYEGKKFKIYFPFATMLIISFVLTFFINLFNKIFK